MATVSDRLDTARRIVVKTGSALVADVDGTPRLDWLKRLAADIAHWRQDGREVLLVSSGAIALGKGRLPISALRRLDGKQAAAAIGQPLLMGALSSAFAAQGLTLAQSLLTLEDTEHRRRWLNARATLDVLLKAGTVPVINENDTVATEEIRYGDNDRLAARVAQMVSADLLILLSDIDGLYTADPKTDGSAEHIAEVDCITPEIEAMGGGASVEGVGSGGMATKLAAAKIAHAAGCSTVITLGDRQAPLAALQEGARATWIIPSMSPQKARRSWLKGHLTPEGAVTVDSGAAEALAGGASLLPVGITSVDGTFERGAALAVKSADGTMIAKGVTAYSASDIRRIAGKQTDDVETILGAARRPAVIHRDDLLMED
ncbi:MAG: glutamate 5-kinase [Pseudomonadota bacterium]